MRRFFERVLEWNKEIHLLKSGQGDLIAPHCDVHDGYGVLEKVRERVALFTLFLNGRDGPEGLAYEGGELVLHPNAERDQAQRVSTRGQVGARAGVER